MFQERIVSFFYLKIFVVIVVVLVIGSICIRITSEVLESSFRNNSFSLLLVSHDSKLIYVDKANKSVLFLALGDIRSIVKGKGPIEASLALGVPINGMIIDEKSPTNLSDFTSSSNISRLVFSGDTPVFKNLDKYDIYKLSNAIRGAISDNTHEIRVNIFNQDEMRDKVGDLFKDSIINNMSYTVEIDNGTTINGLGNDLAAILGREGYNIIAVRTGVPSPNSYIAYPDKSNIYTDSLAGLTGFVKKKVKSSPSADITIFLGDDLDSMLSF